jgi:hypothetical protein
VGAGITPLINYSSSSGLLDFQEKVAGLLKGEVMGWLQGGSIKSCNVTYSQGNYEANCTACVSRF